MDMANYGWKSSLLLFYDALATVDFITASDNDDETCRNSGKLELHMLHDQNRRLVLRE